MTWTLCTSGSAIAKAGANANATIITSGSTLANWSDEVESEACSLARSNVITNFSSLTANGKQVFQTFCSTKIAERIINYDPDAIGRSTATLMINVLENDIDKVTKIITEDKNKTYLGIVT